MVGVAADVLAVCGDVDFAPRPNVAVLVGRSLVPSRAAVPVTSACAVVVDKAGDVLLTFVTGRGYDLPGGHLEPGESPLAACVRELAEEAGLTHVATAAESEPIAAIVLDVAAPRPVGYGYPYPRSQMWIYRFAVAQRQPAVVPAPDTECTHARWFGLDEVRDRFAERIWHPVLRDAC